MGALKKVPHGKRGALKDFKSLHVVYVIVFVSDSLGKWKKANENRKGKMAVLENIC
jgi:hypothetical protein